VGKSGGESWLKLARVVLSLAVSAILLGPGLQAGFVRNVTLLWEHDAGPYSYNVYEATNLLVTPVQWALVTNTRALTVKLPARQGEHYFTVSCIDTNTGLESPLANH
jgi:hypothetical protein